MKNPFETRTCPPWRMELLPPKRSGLALSVLAVGLISVIAVTLHYLHNLKQFTNAESQLASFTPLPDKAFFDASDKEMQAAQVVIQRLVLPWDSLFGALEAASIAGVHLHSVVPDGSRGVVSLAGEAPDIYQVIEYWRVLKSQSVLKNVVLSGYAVSDSENGNAVNFTITASWREQHGR